MFKKCQKKESLRKTLVFELWDDILLLVGDYMGKKRKTKKSIKRIFFLGLTSLAVIVGTTYTTCKYWVEIYDKYKEKKQLKQELTKLKEKEEQLQVDADKLQDPDYIARYAREKYSYSKAGEIILRIP